MRYILCVAVIFFTAGISGCAGNGTKPTQANDAVTEQTQVTQSEKIEWEFDNEFKKSSVKSATFGSLLAGSLLGLSAKNAFPENLSGIFTDGIPLAPTELSRVIRQTVTPPSAPMAAAQIQNKSSATNTHGVESLALGYVASEPSNNFSANAQSGVLVNAEDGVMTTSWQKIPGKVSGVLWWKIEYLTEVRHIISVKPSYHTNSESNFILETEVRERPNDKYDWMPADPELGRSSFREILKEIILAVDDEIYGRKNKI